MGSNAPRRPRSEDTTSPARDNMAATQNTVCKAPMNAAVDVPACDAAFPTHVCVQFSSFEQKPASVCLCVPEVCHARVQMLNLTLFIHGEWLRLIRSALTLESWKGSSSTDIGIRCMVLPNLKKTVLCPM